MYHCHIHFYLMGRQDNVFKIIKEMSPLQHFTHSFSESSEPENVMASQADVIFADLQGKEAESVLQTLLRAKGSETELIVLTEKERIALLTDSLQEIKDIWIMPMDEEEIRFRFLRWQQTCKMSKDFRETSHFLEAAMENSPNLIWYKDKEGVHEKVNGSFCKTVNKTKEQVQGQKHAYIWDVEQDDPACIESEREVMQKKATCVSEETVETGDGIKLLTTYKSPLYDFDGSVMGTVGLAIDVTKEHVYEEEIIRKNHALERIFTAMDCGIICHTVDGAHIISINEAALKILGYTSQDELMASGFDMVVSSVIEEDKAKVRKSMESLKNEGDSVNVEYRVLHDDGEIRHVMGNVKMLKENGELFYQRLLLDCTVQKQMEKKEREINEKRQKELVQALSIDYNMVCVFDFEKGTGSVLRLNDDSSHMFESVFGEETSLEEGKELYIQRFVYEDDREMLRQVFSPGYMREKLEEKGLYYINYRAYENEQITYFQMKVVRAGMQDGKYRAVVGFRSVDEEIRNEIRKQRLLEDALLQANKANKAKSVFLSNMSHDIRTPMNAIVGFTSLAITHIDRKEQVETYLRKIKASGNHLLSLINDVLDMSRIESGKMHLEEKLCTLPDIVYGLRSILQADIQAKQLEFVVETVDVLDEEIYCDKLRLNQVLLNLLSNAVKYTGEGGAVSMRIAEKPGAPTGCASYEFVIKDTGIGMSSEFVSRIFEPFERERNSTISGIQGTGLGMAITKNIVDMMEGSIEVSSTPGEGTEVTVFFTFRLYNEAKKPELIPELKNSRALVIADDFNACDNISHILTEMGMRAEWTLSGNEALLRTRQAVRRGDGYDVYIIDDDISDMSSMEITRQIGKEMGRNVPLVVLMSYDWTEIEEEAKEAGVTVFCSKPLFWSELGKCLHTAVNMDEDDGNEIDRRIAKVHTGRILLAEDNEMNQEIAKAILEEAGFCIEVAENGQIAVDMLKKSQPGYYQLILMDVQMPVMNGYEATEVIRNMEDKGLSSIPILAMTANAFEEDKREALKCGMNGHIAKPIDIDNLFDMLGRILT